MKSSSADRRTSTSSSAETKSSPKTSSVSSSETSSKSSPKTSSVSSSETSSKSSPKTSSVSSKSSPKTSSVSSPETSSESSSDEEVGSTRQSASATRGAARQRASPDEESASLLSSPESLSSKDKKSFTKKRAKSAPETVGGRSEISSEAASSGEDESPTENPADSNEVVLNCQQGSNAPSSPSARQSSSEGDLRSSSPRTLVGSSLQAAKRQEMPVSSKSSIEEKKLSAEPVPSTSSHYLGSKRKTPLARDSSPSCSNFDERRRNERKEPARVMRIDRPRVLKRKRSERDARTDTDSEDEAVGRSQRRRVERMSRKSRKQSNVRAEEDSSDGDLTQSVPPEIMEKIFGLLDLKSLIRAGQVCHRWRVLAKDRHFWQNRDLKLERPHQLLSDFARDSHFSDSYSDLSTCSDSEDEMGRLSSKYFMLPDDKALDERLGRFVCKRKIRNYPEVRSFFTTLLAAPCLRALYISDKRDTLFLFLRHILTTDCKVRILHYQGWSYNMPRFIRLLEWAADSLVELHLKELEAPLMPVIAEMPCLQVLSFQSASRQRDGVPVLPRPGPLRRSSLRVFRAEGPVSPRTVHTVMRAHAATLRVLQISCFLTTPILRIMAKCRELRELHIPCQRNLCALITAAPALQRLTLVLTHTVQDPLRLRLLPEHVTVTDLVVFAPHRVRLKRDVEALAEGCKALPHLKTLAVHSQDWRKNMHPEVHRQFLLRHLPKVQVSFVRMGGPRR